MDEISRELPPDTTTPGTAREHGKGPEELLAFNRGRTSEELVVKEPGSSDAADADPSRELRSPENRMPRLPEPRELPEDQLADDQLVDGQLAEDQLAEDQTRERSSADRLGEPLGDTAEVGEVYPGDLSAGDISAGDAAAALAAEADTAEIEEDLAGADEEGLPAVPELADAAAVAKIVYVLMLSSREGLSIFRLAQACNTTQKLVDEALTLLQADLQTMGLPVELARNGDTVKWMSGPETFPYLQRLRGVKKLEKLSPAALETLAVIAYRQPVMRGEIEAVRGVKAGPMLRTLLQHKLVKVTGRADVPGRPLQYGTTQQFLERFGLGSLQELPSIKEWKNLG